MKKIPLRRDGTVRAYALVDDADAVHAEHRWHICNSYVARSIRIDGKRAMLYLHREVMGAAADVEIDHRDGNRLDNRRSNLRPLDQAHNKQNLALRKDSRSGIRGVSWHKEGRSWRVRVGGKHIGFFKDIDDAALAARNARQAMMPYSEETRHALAQ